MKYLANTSIKIQNINVTNLNFTALCIILSQLFYTLISHVNLRVQYASIT